MNNIEGGSNHKSLKTELESAFSLYSASENKKIKRTTYQIHDRGPG